MSNKSVLGVTLARGGSRGVPGKNIAMVDGKPLLEYTIKEAQKSRLIDRYIVSTDSPEIADVARKLGAEVPFLRPSELADDRTTSVEALQHAVTKAEAFFSTTFDIVVELMATNPFKVAEDIDRAITELLKSGADSVIAVKRVTDGHPARIKRIHEGRIVNFCVDEALEGRRQDLSPAAFIRCGAIYALTREELMIHGRRYGSDFSLPIELDFGSSVNIDDPNDLKLAEILLREIRLTN